MVIKDITDLRELVENRIDAILGLDRDDLSTVLADIIIIANGIANLENVKTLNDPRVDAVERAKAETLFKSVKIVIQAAAKNFDELTLESEEPE